MGGVVLPAPKGVEARDAGQHPTVCRTSPQQRLAQPPEVSSAEAERPGVDRGVLAPLRQAQGLGPPASTCFPPPARKPEEEEPAGPMMCSREPHSKN